MHVEDFRPFITAELLMGPNSLRILEELLAKHPLQLTSADILLDLGCGKGLTSLAAARETPAQVYAADLWLSEEENEARFARWGVGDRVTAFQEDAAQLDFDQNLFSALISVDAYHYFATDESFFAEKILPFLKDGATVLIGIPGVKEAYAHSGEELLSPWLGEDAYMFKSPAQWQAIIGTHERIASVETWEMGCFDAAWAEWFATGHEYAYDDRQFFDTLIAPCTCFVGICVKLK